jgi:hypothetical protein
VKTCRHPWWEPLLMLGTLAIAAPFLLVWAWWPRR